MNIIANCESDLPLADEQLRRHVGPRPRERLKPLAELGLVEVSDPATQVSAKGWFFVRLVAMVFDRHLQTDRDRERFSRII